MRRDFATEERHTFSVNIAFMLDGLQDECTNGRGIRFWNRENSDFPQRADECLCIYADQTCRVFVIILRLDCISLSLNFLEGVTS